MHLYAPKFLDNHIILIGFPEKAFKEVNAWGVLPCFASMRQKG
jgi:hypothetical protein